MSSHPPAAGDQDSTWPLTRFGAHTARPLPRWTRVKRCCWRWLELAWLVFGAVLGGTAGAVGTLILKQIGAG